MRGYTFQFGRGVGAIMEAIVSANAGRLPWGEDHHAAYRKLVNRRIGLSAICEDLPEEHNRVTLDPVLKDCQRHSRPETRLHHQRQQPEDDDTTASRGRRKFSLPPAPPISAWKARS